MTKIVLITGGSRGIGKNMALQIAAQGNDVILTYHTQKQLAEQVVEQIAQLGQRAYAIPLDTSNGSGMSAFAEKIKAVLSTQFSAAKFDALINNAGIGSYEPIADMTVDSLDTLYNIHFKSVYLLAKELTPIMHAGGSIINISSGYSRFSAVGFSAYGALKGAVDTLTRFQALEFAPLNIRVNAIAPGAIETDFAGGIVRDNEDVNQYIKTLTALGRTGQPDDIGGVAAFLISEAAKWITGQRIEVSGGIYL